MPVYISRPYPGSTRPIRRFFIFTLTAILSISCLPGISSFSSFTLLAEESQHFLLMQPIQDAMTSGNFFLLKNISENRISVNFEPPLELNGYFYIDKFIDDFTREFSLFETKKIEWASRQLEESYSVQSLNLTLKNKRTEKDVIYKFIFFLTKTGKEWKIYYLKGLKI
jgi:hypothetical protein